ncbi:MAG: nicotinate phosphoribosyltransferase [Bryobacteraceae bacterium]
MHGLLTDLYELTMAAGYVAAGKADERATFELFFRRLPRNRNFVIAAGLAQAVDYLLSVSYSNEEIAYLRTLSQFRNAPEEFWRRLHEFRFTGDVWAVPEGTPVFPNEPILTLRAPMLEAQIPETYLLSMIGFQSMIASKAARIVESAGGRSVVEFGTRRAHSPEAGTLAARAAYIGGCIGSSNTESGYRYGIPVFGTSAHSWVQSFETEPEAFRRLQELLGPDTVQLIDTFDTLEGARHAAALGRPLWGVRLDSGNLAVLSRAVRRILNDAGLHDARIMASGDLDEYKILEMTAANLPIDALGVGTDLSTSSDAPKLGVVYKLVEMRGETGTRYTAKFSTDKATFPGPKQIFRYAGHDEVGCAWECPSCGSNDAEPAMKPLLRPVVVNGRLVAPLPEPGQIRSYAAESLAALPAMVRSLAQSKTEYRVEYTAELRDLYAKVAAREHHA